MNSEILGAFFIAVLAISASRAMVAAARRARPLIDPETGNPALRYQRWVRLCGLVYTLVIPLLVAVPVIAIPENRSLNAFIIAATISALFLLAGGYLLAEAAWVSITWSDTEIRSSSPWTGKRVVPWHEIARVRFSPFARWFVIESRSGVVIRAHEMLNGLPTLVKTLESKVEPRIYAGWEDLISKMSKRAV